MATAGTTSVLALTESRVGIGTTDPSYNMHIKGSSYPVALIESTDSHGGDLMLKSSSSLWEMLLEGADLQIWENQSDIRMTIKSGGNVGIGSASPSCTLDVAGSAKIKSSTNSTTAVQTGNGTLVFTKGILTSFT